MNFKKYMRRRVFPEPFEQTPRMRLGIAGKPIRVPRVVVVQASGSTAVVPEIRPWLEEAMGGVVRALREHSVGDMPEALRPAFSSVVKFLDTHDVLAFAWLDGKTGIHLAGRGDGNIGVRYPVVAVDWSVCSNRFMEGVRRVEKEKHVPQLERYLLAAVTMHVLVAEKVERIVGHSVPLSGEEYLRHEEAVSGILFDHRIDEAAMYLAQWFFPNDTASPAE